MKRLKWLRKVVRREGRRWLVWLAAVAVLAEVYSLLPRRVSPARDGALPYALGAIHVHSRYSHDGGGDVETIARSAREAGLDFVVLTDHDNNDALDAGYHREVEGVDIFVETETSLPMGHALLFYSHSPLASRPDDEVTRAATDRLLTREKRDETVFQAIAHPTNAKRPWSRLDLFAEGVEIANLDSFWRRQLSESKLRFLTTAALYPVNSYLALLRFLQVDRRTLAVWDHMNAISPGHFGIVAHDTHARIPVTQSTGIAWPHYREMFRLASNVVFLGKNAPAGTHAERQKTIYRAIRGGRMAVVFQAVHPFATSEWVVSCKGRSARSGDRVAFDPSCRSTVRVPDSLRFPATVRLFRNGRLSREVPATGEPIALSEPGVYRVEVWARPRTLTGILLDDWTPYVLYNPIYVD